MKIVHVLGDQSLEETFFLEFGKYPVSFAWLFADQSPAHFAIQLPGFVRTVEKDVEGGVFIRREDGPYSTWAAEVGDAAGNGDACAGECSGGPGLSEFRHRFFEVGFVLPGVIVFITRIDRPSIECSAAIGKCRRSGPGRPNVPSDNSDSSPGSPP